MSDFVTLTVDLIGMAPIGFSGPVLSEKEDNETHAAFEERTWREKMHVDGDGMVFIPQMALKNAMASIAKYQSEKIGGKGMKTFTKHFEAGVIVPDPLCLGIKVEDVKPQKQFVPSDGVRGGGKRVWKWFPVIPQPWKTTAKIVLLDDILVAHWEKVQDYVKRAGLLIGLGWWRPERLGLYGRYNAENFRWVPDVTKVKAKREEEKKEEVVT